MIVNDLFSSFVPGKRYSARAQHPDRIDLRVRPPRDQLYRSIAETFSVIPLQFPFLSTRRTRARSSLCGAVSWQPRTSRRIEFGGDRDRKRRRKNARQGRRGKEA